MEELREPQNSNLEDEDPLAPLSEHATLIDRVAEINSGNAPRKSTRQRIGSMAARQSVRRYDGEERPHIVEQAYVAESRRFLNPSVDPRTA